MSNILPFINPNKTSLTEEIKTFAQSQTADSLDELNAKLQEFSTIKNNAPKDYFLGLSPTQMHLALYNNFSLINHIFTFNLTDNTQLTTNPILNQALFFLNRLQYCGELKGTQLGNLPKDFVIEFYHLFLSNDRYARLPSREDDLPQLTRLKHLLDLAGLIKKRNKKFSLTKKGQTILAQENHAQLFKTIIETWVNSFNFGFSDGYHNYSLIQQATVFNFYLLYKLANDWISGEELGTYFLNAFPTLALHSEFKHSSAEEEIVRCFSLRFLDRFCLPLGLVEQKDNGKYFSERVEYYKVTSFFKDNFKIVF